MLIRYIVIAGINNTMIFPIIRVTDYYDYHCNILSDRIRHYHCQFPARTGLRSWLPPWRKRPWVPWPALEECPWRISPRRWQRWNRAWDKRLEKDGNFSFCSFGDCGWLRTFADTLFLKRFRKRNIHTWRPLFLQFTRLPYGTDFKARNWLFLALQKIF